MNPGPPGGGLEGTRPGRPLLGVRPKDRGLYSELRKTTDSPKKLTLKAALTEVLSFLRKAENESI